MNDPSDFHLNSSSICIQAGLNITNNGGLDFYGAPLNTNTTDIGCAQFFGGHTMLNAVSYGGSGFVLSCFNGAPDQTYQILTSPGLTNGLIHWTPIASGTCDGSGSFQYQDNDASNHVSRFYTICGPVSSAP